MGSFELSAPILGIAGMPGSGKSIVASFARSLGYTIFSMGDVVREYAKSRGIDATPEELGGLMLALRAEYGPRVIAEKTIDKIHRADASRICVEGLRSIVEAELFRQEFPNFLVVAVHSSPRTRFLRLTKRERRDDPKSHQIFEERDRREIGVGLGGVIALADFAVINEGSVEDLTKAASIVLKLADIAV